MDTTLDFLFDEAGIKYREIIKKIKKEKISFDKIVSEVISIVGDKNVLYCSPTELYLKVDKRKIEDVKNKIKNIPVLLDNNSKYVVEIKSIDNYIVLKKRR